MVLLFLYFLSKYHMRYSFIIRSRLKNLNMPDKQANSSLFSSFTCTLFSLIVCNDPGSQQASLIHAWTGYWTAWTRKWKLFSTGHLLWPAKQSLNAHPLCTIGFWEMVIIHAVSRINKMPFGPIIHWGVFLWRSRDYDVKALGCSETDDVMILSHTHTHTHTHRDTHTHTHTHLLKPCFVWFLSTTAACETIYCENAKIRNQIDKGGIRIRFYVQERMG